MILSHKSTTSSSHSVGTAEVGFKLTSEGNYDMDKKRLTNLSEGLYNDDAITTHQMEVALSNKLNPRDVLLLNGQN